MAHYKGAASEAGRAMQLLKKREQAQMEIEFRKKKIEEDLKISNIENKFAAHYDAVEQQLKTSTIGLVTLDEMKAKQENIVKERERKLAQKQAEKEREQQRQLEAKQAEKNRQRKQSLETDSDGDDDGDDSEDSEENMESQEVRAKGKKRKNKNRPQEISSKAPVKMNRKNANRRILDPRFDSLCGEYDEKSFSNHYSFIDKIKEREHKRLAKAFRKEKDPVKKGKIKFLLDRISNQKRSQKKNEFIKSKMEEEKQKYVAKIKKGEKASFPRKTDIKMLGIVNDFENLQKSGKLEKYMSKKNKAKSMPTS